MFVCLGPKRPFHYTWSLRVNDQQQQEQTLPMFETCAGLVHCSIFNLSPGWIPSKTKNQPVISSLSQKQRSPHKGSYGCLKSLKMLEF